MSDLSWQSSGKGYLEAVWTYPSLRDNIVWVAPRKTRTLKQVHDLCLARTFPIERILVLLETNSATEVKFGEGSREATIGV